MRSGTLSDKIASLTLQIQKSPFFHLNALKNLVNSASKKGFSYILYSIHILYTYLLIPQNIFKGRREAELSIKNLTELFCSSLLPKNRHLLKFSSRCVSNQYVCDSQLLLWWFEGELKRVYSLFLNAVESGCRDEVFHFKDLCIKTLYRLLCDVPEQEKRVLTILINKMGDKERKIASKVPYLLGLLLQKHSNMRSVVVSEVERFLYQAHIPDSSRYYAVIFLNQIALSRDDTELAKSLILIYFSLFRSLVEWDDKIKEIQKLRKKEKRRKSKSERVKEGFGVSTKMLGALLTGVSRAVPYLPVEEDDVVFSSHLDTLFRVVHITTFSKSCQALLLIFQVLSRKEEISSRFYRSLYRLMLSQELANSRKQSLFLNLVYRAIKADTSVNRVKAMSKRLLQVSMHQRSSFICGALIVFSETLRLHSKTRDMVRISEKEELEKLKEEAILDEEKERAGLLYDPYNRDPLYARAGNSCIWELSILMKHTHPTVAKFSKQLLNLKWIKYDSDPLMDFSLMSFLDRFSYKTPTKKVL